MKFDMELDFYTQSEIKRLLDGLDSEFTELNQLLYLIDKVWDELECDNQVIDEDKMSQFYSHPVWTLNGSPRFSMSLICSDFICACLAISN